MRIEPFINSGNFTNFNLDFLFCIFFSYIKRAQEKCNDIQWEAIKLFLFFSFLPYSPKQTDTHHKTKRQQVHAGDANPSNDTPIPPTPIHFEKTPSLVIKKKKRVALNHEIQPCAQIGWSWMNEEEGGEEEEEGVAGLFLSVIFLTGNLPTYSINQASV